MYLDREWRIPQQWDSPIRWPGPAAFMAVWSPYCAGWHVTGVGNCYTDPMGLLVTYGNDWDWVDIEGAERGIGSVAGEGGLSAAGVPGIYVPIHL